MAKITLFIFMFSYLFALVHLAITHYISIVKDEVVPVPKYIYALAEVMDADYGDGTVAGGWLLVMFIFLIPLVIMFSTWLWPVSYALILFYGSAYYLRTRGE